MLPAQEPTVTEPTAAAQRPRAGAQAGLQRLKRVTWGSVLLGAAREGLRVG